ncbi:MAG TPA: hypothetical protein VF342_07610 [Alphaproteobacteria bacterium]
MRNVLLCVAGALAGALAAVSVLTVSVASHESRFVPMLGDDVVIHIMNIAQRHLPEGRAEDATASDDRSHPITLEDGRYVVDIAAASAAAAWCGLDWQDGNFRPMMALERAKGIRTEQALAYIDVLHGVAMDLFETDLRSAGACSERRRTEVAQFIAERWN